MNPQQSRWQQAGPGLALMVALIAAWEVAARLQGSPNFPGFSRVLQALATSGPDILREMSITLARAFAGWLLALLVMLPLGILIGRMRRLGEFIEPILDLLRPLPPLAVVPVAMLFAGTSSAAKILVVFYGCAFPIVLSAIDAVRGAHPMLTNVARSLGLSRRETMLLVDLPAALPQIAVGIRIGVALALLISVSAEMLLSTDGIGTFIMRSQESFQVASGLAALVVIALVALAINGLVLKAEHRLLRWSHARQGAAAQA